MNTEYSGSCTNAYKWQNRDSGLSSPLAVAITITKYNDIEPFYGICKTTDAILGSIEIEPSRIYTKLAVMSKIKKYRKSTVKEGMGRENPWQYCEMLPTLMKEDKLCWSDIAKLSCRE